MYGLMMPFLNMVDDMHEAESERIQKCIDDYYEAKKYPRKKKKSIRKKANEDYAFFTSIQEWRKKQFGF